MARPNIAALTNATASPIAVLNKILDAMSVGVFPRKASYFNGDVNTLVPTIDSIYLLGAGVTNGVAGELIVFRSASLSSQVAYPIAIGTIVDGYTKILGDWSLVPWTDGSVLINNSSTLNIPVFVGKVFVGNSTAVTYTSSMIIQGQNPANNGSALIISNGVTVYVS